MSNIWIGGFGKWRHVPQALFKTKRNMKWNKSLPTTLFFPLKLHAVLTDWLTLAATHPRDSLTHPMTNTLDTDRSVPGECKSLWRPELVLDWISTGRSAERCLDSVLTEIQDRRAGLWKLNPLPVFSRQSVISQTVERQVLLNMRVKVGTIGSLHSEKTSECNKIGDSLLLHHQYCTTRLNGVSCRS